MKNGGQQAIKYFWPKKFSNKYVRHGIQYESVARKLYEKKKPIK